MVDGLQQQLRGGTFWPSILVIISLIVLLLVSCGYFGVSHVHAHYVAPRAQDRHCLLHSVRTADLQWQREEKADCRSCRAEGKGRRVEHVVFVLVVGVGLRKAQEQEGDAMSEREREFVIEIKTGNSSVTESEFILSI